MAKEALEKLSDDTITCLEQAKKGKARKFVMVCKGATIANLVVYKKGSVEKFKKEAKEAGSGQVAYGVVTGSGMELNFQLARADGFEKAPVKSMTLKEFLDERADFRCKPLFEIVDSALVVLDDDDPLVKRFQGLQPQALAACDKHTDRAEEINTLCLQIGKLLEGENSDQAATKIGDLEKLLASLGSAEPIPPAPPPPPQSSPPPTQPTDDGTAAFTARLTALKPELEKAFGTGLPAAQDIKLLVSQAGVHARKKEFPQANELLDQVERDLKKLPTKNPLAETWQQRRDEIEPKFKEFAKSAPPDRVEKLKKILDLAIEKAGAGEFKTALQAINQLEPLLSSEPAPTTKPVGAAALGDEQLSARAKEVRQIWLQAKGEVDTQMNALQRAMKATGDPVWARLAEFGVAGVTKRQQTGLMVSLMNLEQARGEAKQKTVEQALKSIADFQKLLSGDKSVDIIEANPFGVQIGLRRTLGAALSKMERSLTT